MRIGPVRLVRVKPKINRCESSRLTNEVAICREHDSLLFFSHRKICRTPTDLVQEASLLLHLQDSAHQLGTLL
jgi:hypothetical protein